MDSRMDLRLVSSYNGWRNESEHWIFHTTKGKCWRQDKNIVLAPSIRDTDPIFDLIEVALETAKLLFSAFNLLWLRNQSNSVTQWHSLKITNSESNQIAWNFDLRFKLVLLFAILCFNTRTIGTHHNIELLWYTNNWVISYLDSRCILHRGDRPTSNSLALRKEIRHLFTQCLLSWKPAKSVGWR